MPFEKGNRANPGGRPKDKPWRDALRLALFDGDKAPLRDIAESVVKLAREGDMEAIKEIGNRLDGKPHQSMDVDAELAGELGFRWLTGSEKS